MNRKNLLWIFAGLFLLVNLFGVMAFNGGFGPFGSYGSVGGSPLYVLLNDEWVQVAIIFMVFFGVIFFATKKVFKSDPGVAAVVSVAISLIVSMSLYRAGYLFDYFGGEIGSLAVFFAVLLAIAFLIRLIYVNLGKGMTALLLIILYPVIVMVDLSSWLPAGGVLYFAERFQAFVGSWFGIILYIIILVVILAQTDGITKMFRRFGRGM